MALKLEVVPRKAVVVRRGKAIVAACWFGPDVRRPYVYPFIGPHGLGMTRSFPIKTGVPGESHDHPHQKPMFFAYGWVNGVNFFAESPGCGKTVHDQLLKVQSGSERELIRTTNNWVANRLNALLYSRNAQAYQRGEYRAWDGPAFDDFMVRETARLEREFSAQTNN